MPVSFDVDATRGIVHVRFSGILVRDDLQALARGLVATPDFRSDFDELVDTRDVESLRITRRDLEENVRWDLFGRGSRRAVVATDDSSLGMARMFELLRSGKPDDIRVFRSMEDARSWLGLEGD